MDDYDFLFKIVLVGNSGVGKTSIAENFVDKTFSGSFESTIGVDFKTKIINIEGKRMKIQIWDTAGQEKFRSITRSYYRSADAMVVVFDLSKKESYDGIDGWLEEVEKMNNNPALFLVGNKTDLAREINKDDAYVIAQNNNMVYTECSAKTSENIDLLFDSIARVTFQHCLKNDKLRVNNNVNLERKSLKFRKCC